MSDLSPAGYDEAGKDRTLAAIILTSQVVPHLLAPDLLLLAAEEVARRWRRYLSQWDDRLPAADLPAGPPMRLVEFVDRYCVEVEHGAGADGCAGRHGSGRCDPDACAAAAWLAHVKALAGPTGLVQRQVETAGAGRGAARGTDWAA